MLSLQMVVHHLADSTQKCEDKKLSRDHVGMLMTTSFHYLLRWFLKQISVLLLGVVLTTVD